MTYNTEKRKEICRFLSENEGQAYSAEEICKTILEDGKGKSTVYRILSKLVDEGVIRRITDVNSRRVTYQNSCTGHCASHLHLKCKGCGKLIHLNDETSKLLENRILGSEGFALDSGALLYGRCESCIYPEKRGYNAR